MLDRNIEVKVWFWSRLNAIWLKNKLSRLGGAAAHPVGAAAYTVGAAVLEPYDNPFWDFSYGVELLHRWHFAWDKNSGLPKLLYWSHALHLDQYTSLGWKSEQYITILSLSMGSCTEDE